MNRRCRYPELRSAAECLETRTLLSGAPVITSDGGTSAAVVRVLEGTTLVTDIDASVDSAARKAVVEEYNTEYLPHLSVENGWTGSTDACDAGTNSAAYQQATESMINYFRGMAGLPDIALDPSLDAEALEAALMMEANNRLSHDPPSSWDCYSTTGSDAAGSSNLYLGRTGPSAIAGYIEDPGASNTRVGHRRWILYPRLLTLGSGSTSRANALKVFGGEGQRGDRPVGPKWVSWPPSGFVPQELVYPRWSLSSNEFPNADYAGASVAMTDGDNQIDLRVNAVANGFGDNTLVWEPQGLQLRNNQTLTVTVSNIVIDGEATSHSYDVTVIDPAGTPSEAGLTYGLSSSADESFFAIDETTGVLTFKQPPDATNPQDAGANNVHNVAVQVSDSSGQTDSQLISVVVVPDSSREGTYDIDNDGTATRDNDGLFLLRYLAGFTGDELFDGVVNSSGGRTDRSEILQFVRNRLSLLDVDASGTAQGLSDGILIRRGLAGTRGTSLVTHAVESNAARIESNEVAEFIAILVPMSDNSSVASAPRPVAEQGVETGLEFPGPTSLGTDEVLETEAIDILFLEPRRQVGGQ